MASGVTIYQVGANWNWEVFVNGAYDSDARRDFVNQKRRTTITRDHAFDVTLTAGDCSYGFHVKDNEHKEISLKFKLFPRMEFVKC
jgi:hypothetical protein